LHNLFDTFKKYIYTDVYFLTDISLSWATGLALGGKNKNDV